jgi:hypothetical protein
VRYLYGDGMESPLSINYLDYLRLTLEFSVSVLESQSRVKELYAQAKQKKLVAEHEAKNLDTLQRIVAESLITVESKITAPRAIECAGVLKAITANEIARTKEMIQETLSRDLAHIQDTVVWERAENERRLEKLLLQYDIPGSEYRVGMSVLDETGYQVELTTRSDLDVDAVILLSVPADHLLSRPIRIDSIDPELSIKIPQNSSWGWKDIKIRPQKLTKEYVASITPRAEGIHMALRNGFADSHSGYDIALNDNQVTVTRIARQEVGEAFALDADDATRLVTFIQTIYASMYTLTSYRRMVKQINIEGVPLSRYTEPETLVRRLLEQAGPVAREIASRSRSPGELILKRVLSDDRREEIFVSVTELKQLYAGLSKHQRKLFIPLGFDQNGFQRPDAGAVDMIETAPLPRAPRPKRSVGPPRPSSAAPPVLPKPTLPRPSVSPPQRPSPGNSRVPMKPESN